MSTFSSSVHRSQFSAPRPHVRQNLSFPAAAGGAVAREDSNGLTPQPHLRQPGLTATEECAVCDSGGPDGSGLHARIPIDRDLGTGAEMDQHIHTRRCPTILTGPSCARPGFARCCARPGFERCCARPGFARCCARPGFERLRGCARARVRALPRSSFVQSLSGTLSTAWHSAHACHESPLWPTVAHAHESPPGRRQLGRLRRTVTPLVRAAHFFPRVTPLRVPLEYQLSTP